MFLFVCCPGRWFCVLCFVFHQTIFHSYYAFNLQDMLPRLSASYTSVNGILGEASECMENGRIDANLTSPSNYSSLTQQENHSNHPIEHGLTGGNKIAFSSLPSLHINDQAELSASQNLINQNHHSSDAGGRIIKSCPEQIASGRNSGISSNQLSPPADLTENNTQRKYFPSHWSIDDVNEGLQVSVTF